MQDNTNSVRVVKRIVWDVLITDRFGEHSWLHDSEEEAVRRADRMVAKKLVTIRGKDSL